jgi:excisionase family DNA binding protein
VLLKVQEVAELLQVSKWTVYRWIEEGKLHATKIGGNSLRVFQVSVDKLMDQTKARHDQGKVVEQGSKAQVGGTPFKKGPGSPRERTQKRKSNGKGN